MTVMAMARSLKRQDTNMPRAPPLRARKQQQ